MFPWNRTLAKRMGRQRTKQKRLNSTDTRREPLLGTAKHWDAHIVVSTEVPASQWPKDISEYSSVVKSLNTFFANRKRSPNFSNIRVSLCNLHDTPAGSVILFSTMLKYPLQFRNYTEKSQLLLSSVVDALDKEAKPVVDPLKTFATLQLQDLQVESRKGYFAFVCAHAATDELCGKCGPVIYEELTKLVSLLSFESEQVPLTVGQISHVGGHKYAGNLLLYPPGDLYGYVSESNVLDIVKTHILATGVKEDHWRGRMGVPPEKLPDLLQQLKSTPKDVSSL